jgi:hypothetical protein
MTKIDFNTETVFLICTDCFETTFVADEVTDEKHLIAMPAVVPGTSYKSANCKHVDGVPGHAEEHREECERIEFSSKPCDNCGTHLAGTRYFVTTFEVTQDD